MSAWDDFLGKVQSGVVTDATTALNGFVNEAKADAQAYINGAENDLKVWTQQLAANEIDADDFADFVKADARLAEMAALSAAGIAAADLQRFRDALITTIVDAATSTFKI
jgi:hypothetical protein